MALVGLFVFAMYHYSLARENVRNSLSGFEKAIRSQVLSGSKSEIYETCRSRFSDQSLRKLVVNRGAVVLCDFSRDRSDLIVTDSTPVLFDPYGDAVGDNIAGEISLSIGMADILAVGTLFLIFFAALLGVGLIVLRNLEKVIGQRVIFPLESLAFELSSRDGKSVNALAFKGIDGGLKEIQDLIVAFNGLAGRLDESQKQLVVETQRATFVDVSRQVAHDIRSPLSAIQSVIGMLATSKESQTQVLQKACERIQFIADDLLAKTRERTSLHVNHAETSKKPSGECLLSRVVEDIVAEKAAEFFKSPVKLESRSVTNAEGIRVAIQAFDLSRILSNLINNAFAATAEGKIVIETGIKGSNAFVVVRDQGHGMPPEILENLGKKEISSREKGSGLGVLSAVQKVESCGGKVLIHSKVGHGTQVCIELPTI